MTPEARRKANQYRLDGSIDIRSYDLFLDITRNVDKRKKDPSASVYMAERKCHH